MTHHPCAFPHVLGYGRPADEPNVDVRHEKSKGWTDAEVAEFATRDFEPWDASNNPLPSNEQWGDLANPHLFALRIAFAILCKTKAELVEVASGSDGDDVFSKVVGQFDQTEKLFEGYAQICGAALARLVVAGCVVDTREKNA